MATEMAKDRPEGEQTPDLVKSIIADFGGPGTKKERCTAPDCLWGSAGDGDVNEVVGCVQDGPFKGWEVRTKTHTVRLVACVLAVKDRPRRTRM